MTNCQTPKTNNEQRKAIFLTKEEKEFVLMEMRELLKALHYIHVGLSNENYEFAYQSSKKVGMNMGGIKSYETFNNDLILEHKAEARISFPEYYRGGIQFDFNFFKIYLDLNYILWNSYFRKIKIQSEAPFITTPFGYSSNTIQIRQNWNNQIVSALGMELYFNTYIFSMGYNYGKIPTPSEGIHPLLTMTIEHHVTLGFAKKLEQKIIYFTYEHGFKNKSEFELSKTSFVSDWFLFHTNLKPIYFKYSRSMQLNSLIFGIESKI